MGYFRFASFCCCYNVPQFIYFFLFCFRSPPPPPCSLGSSHFSDPIYVRLTNQTYLTLYEGVYTAIVAIFIAIVVVIVLILKIYKQKYSHKISENGVAFDNPSYLREINIEHFPSQVREVYNFNWIIFI